MSHRHHGPHDRPLIDLIPENSHGHDLDVSDEEDAFYAVDEGDYLLHPKWRTLLTRTSSRIPRRLQRLILIYGLGLVFSLTLWFALVGPRYKAYMQDTWDMNAWPKDRFGLNKRPEFKDLVQIKKLDERYLPKGEGRLVVVGDVHGCKESLEELLKRVEFKEGQDHLVLTGDIVAKGPDSPGVVSLASRLNASCVRGNHEDRVLLSIAEATAISGPNESPDRFGVDTLNLIKSFDADQISYLQSLPVILDVGAIGSLQNVVIVHAGLVPDVALEDQDPYQVMNMRTITLKTGLPSEKREGKPWEMLWNHLQQKKRKVNTRTTVIYGHDMKTGLNPQPWSFGLDSGCVTGGRLTAMVIQESGQYEMMDVNCNGGYFP
ncbi:Metallo-dependent phosphatase [Massarina eburnea CBS 473.64]|uniref:Metallo-dependent phosphatase n=1 Tax=Massarina eburnea CBS 473.64 TaxID=1395130 RepID=A0A6A6RHK8_9PLEO|nr:Metallo-dependent phosphatase [Massarina eburnea CBS 473.64]